MNTLSVSVRTLQKVFATLAVFALVFSPLSAVPFAQAACGEFEVVGPTVISNTTTGEFFNSIQDALDDCDTLAGQAIALSGDVTTLAQINVLVGVTIDGNGFTLTPNFARTDNSNNSAIGILDTDGVSIVDLTIDGSLGTNLHGINAYESADVTVSGVTVENINRTGLVVNGSSVK
jgi:hypothetical protein